MSIQLNQAERAFYRIVQRFNRGVCDAVVTTGNQRRIPFVNIMLHGRTSLLHGALGVVVAQHDIAGIHTLDFAHIYHAAIDIREAMVVHSPRQYSAQRACQGARAEPGAWIAERCGGVVGNTNKREPVLWFSAGLQKVCWKAIAHGKVYLLFFLSMTKSRTAFSISNGSITISVLTSSVHAKTG